MANSADPDQLASSDQHCLQMQDISGFSKTRVIKNKTFTLQGQTVGYKSVFVFILVYLFENIVKTARSNVRK